MIQIRSTANVGIEGIKTLVYGKSGVGKTPLAGTAPLPIILSAEAGLLSLRRCNPPVPYIQITNYQELQEACNWLSGSYESRQFFTACLDSLSEIAEIILTAELKKNKDPRKAYGEMAVQTLQLVRWFRDLPGRSVLLIAKEDWAKDETTGMMLYQPMFPGQQIGKQVPYFFDETFQMIAGRTQDNKDWRALRTRVSPQHVARDRSGMLDEFEQPNLTSVFTKILGF